MSAGSQRADVEGERDGTQEQKNEPVKEVNEGSEMTSFALGTLKANEAQDVHSPD